MAPEPEKPKGGKGGYVCASAWDGYRSVLDGSSYCTGYCTWFVWQKRPEQQLKNLGNAWEWYGAAKARGVPVGSTPVVGAVAWWVQSAHAPEGHVAYVVGVNGGSITIEEMNRVAWAVEDTRTISGGELPNGYIYGGPAGNGPGGPGSGGSTPLPPPPTTGGRGGVVNSPNGDQSVYFVGGDGGIHVWLYHGRWEEQGLGGSVAPDTSPIAFENPTGNTFVYYVGSDDAIHLWLWNGSKWEDQDIGGSVASITSPIAFTESSTGSQFVYFIGSDYSIHLWLYGTRWEEQDLGGNAAAGTSPDGF